MGLGHDDGFAVLAVFLVYGVWCRKITKFWFVIGRGTFRKRGLICTMRYTV